MIFKGCMMLEFKRQVEEVIALVLSFFLALTNILTIVVYAIRLRSRKLSNRHTNGSYKLR